MATLIPHAELAKKLGVTTLESQATTVRALLDEVSVRLSAEDWARLRRATILVNGIAIHRLEGLDTPLGEQDKVWMVVPSGGG